MLGSQPDHNRPQVECDVTEIPTNGTLPHEPINHLVFFLCHGFIPFLLLTTLKKLKLVFKE